MALGDILAGLADASHEHQKTLLQMDYQKKAALSQQYAKMAEDDSYPEDMRTEALHRSLGIHMLEPGKKMPKEYEAMTFTARPQSAPAQEQPGSTPPGPDAPFGITMPPVAPPSKPATQEPMAPLPFEERLKRYGQMQGASASVQNAIAKAGQWKKEAGSDLARDFPDGKRHKIIRETRINPDTGEQETRSTDLGDVANFAPRMGDLVTIEDAITNKKLGFEFKNAMGKDLDLGKMMEAEGPYATIRNKGNYYEPATVKNIITSVGNVSQFRNPYAPGAPGTAIGVTHPPTTTSGYRTAGVPQPTGEIKKVPFESSSTRSTATGPIAPPGPEVTNYNPQGFTGGFGDPNVINNAVQGARQAGMNDIALIPPAISAMPYAGQVALPPPTIPPSPPPSRQISQIGPPPVPTPPRSGEVIGGRSLSPEQVITSSQKGEAFGNTADRVSGLMEVINDPNFHFNDFVKRAKLAIAENPNTPTKKVIANLMTLSPQEAKFVADFQSLAEDINLLRTTYSATGFRGPEAFDVLLGQRGQLLGNPAVANQMMRNTLQSVLTQMTPLQQGLSKNGSPLPLTPGVVNAYRWMVTGKQANKMTPEETKKLMEALRQNGWIQ